MTTFSFFENSFMKNVVLVALLVFCCALASAQTPFGVKEVLSPYCESKQLPGVVTIIADKDKILQTDTFGFADIEKQRPMTADSFFWIASQSKPITAAAVMILVDEGKLALKEPITKYIPEMAGLKVAAERTPERTVLVPPNKPITLEMLLSHTAGCEFLTPFQMKYGIDSLSLERSLTTYLMTPLKSQPGTAYNYSNIGINIAASAVERASGMPFEDFLAKRLFEPLGMNDTTFFPNDEQMERLVTAYQFDKKEGTLKPCRTPYMTYPFNDRPRRFAEGGGGIFSTPNDLIKFFQMLAGNGEFNGKRILSAAAVKEIQAKHTGDLPNGYGLGVNTNNGVYGHGGALGTDTLINTNNGRVLLYFIQHQGLGKSEEAKKKFYEIGNRP